MLTVAGAQATLMVDGRALHSSWPQGITGVAPVARDQHARLFQVDGTDTSGTQTFNSGTFGATASTPYYRFLCWMRDCGSYSRWSDLSVRDDRSGRLLLAGGDAVALQRVVLPARFTLQGVLERPDLSGDLLFTGAAGAKVGFSPDGRQMYLQDRSQYYPFDPRPYLAEVGWTITRTLLWSIVLLLIICAGALLLLPLPAMRSWPWIRLTYAGISGGQLDRTLLYIAAGLILLLLLGISNFDYQRLPRLFDATAYYFQAEIIRSGNLWVPSPPSAYNQFFDGPFMVHPSNGHWFAQYAPGTPLAIALGLLVNAPWAVEPIVGAACVILMARLARRWYGRATAWLTLLLVGTSPFFLFLASSYLSHAIGLFALLLCLEGIDRLAATGDWRWAALAGFGGGYSFLTRELDAVLFLMPVAIFYAWRAGPALARRLRADAHLRTGWLRTAAALCVPALLCLGFYFLFNERTTGDALLTPRAAFDSHDTWGFGSGHGWYNMHTVAAGLFIVENQLTALLIHLFGWPYYLTLAFFFMPLITLRLQKHDLLLYGIAGIFLIGYGGYFYHGIAYGPRYLFASLPAYILLTARGIIVAAQVTTAVLCCVAAPARARAAAVTATALALGALCACNLSWYLPRQFSLYYDYLEQRADGGLAYEHIHPSWMHNAVVLTEDSGFYRDVLFPMNDPSLRGDIIYALIPSSQNIKPLMSAYPHRALYLLNIYQRHLIFVRMHVLPTQARAVTLMPRQSTAQLTNLAMDDRGNLFAADTTHGTIGRFSSAGSQLGTIGTDIAPGTIFSIGIWRHALYWFNAHTSVFWHADLQGRHRSKIVLQPPCSACHTFAFTPDGDVIFAVTADSVLYRYSPRGKLLATSSGKGVMRQPVSVAVTADGHVFTYDLELKHTFMFDKSLRQPRILPFGSEGVGGFAISLLAAAGDWLVGTDPGFKRLVAYNAQTGVLRDAMLNTNGDLLSVGAHGLAWDGHQLAIATGHPAVVQTIATGAVPF